MKCKSCSLHIAKPLITVYERLCWWHLNQGTNDNTCNYYRCMTIWSKWNLLKIRGGGIYRIRMRKGDVQWDLQNDNIYIARWLMGGSVLQSATLNLALLCTNFSLQLMDYCLVFMYFALQYINLCFQQSDFLEIGAGAWAWQRWTWQRWAWSWAWQRWAWSWAWQRWAWSWAWQRWAWGWHLEANRIL